MSHPLKWAVEIGVHFPVVALAQIGWGVFNMLNQRQRGVDGFCRRDPWRYVVLKMVFVCVSENRRL